MTRLAGASPDGECPTWKSFLATITNDDLELQAYLQRMVGYALTGLTSEHALFFLYGTGANGKSVFCNVVAAILGDYATTAPMDMFMATTGERHPTDLAGLARRALRVGGGDRAGPPLGREQAQAHDRRRPHQGPVHAPGLLRVRAAVQAGDRRQPQARDPKHR